MTDHGTQDVNPQKSQYLKHLYRGSELLLNDRIAEAREVLEEASRIDPEDPKGLSLLGLVYFRLEEFDRAQQIYELLVGRFPEEASLRVNLGLVYMKQGHAEAARQEMVRAVEIDPNHQRAYGYLGLLYSEDGEHERARVAFAKAGQDAMVQRMDELLARRGQAGSVPAEAAPAVRAPAPTEEVWAEPEAIDETAVPSAPAAAPPAGRPALGAPPPLPGGPAPGGAMTPMMSDAMTQPVPMAPWAPAPVPPEAGSPAEEAPELGFPEATLPEQPVFSPEVLGSDAGLAPALGAPEESPSVAAAPPPAVSPAPTSEPAPEGAELEGDAFDAAFSEETYAAAAEPAPPVEGVASADASELEAWQTGSAPEAGAEAIGEEDVSAALDRAVGPEEPWPAGGGPAVPPGGFVSPPPEAVLAALPEEAPVEAAAQDGAAPVRRREPMPIFSFATTGLVDLGARHDRMTQISDSLLLFPVEEDAFFRAESLVAEVGGFRFEPAFRRAKGANTEEPMSDGRGRFLKARGEGVLLCDAGEEELVVLDLYDDFIYLRSEHLFAFESTLHWENGKIRGRRGPIHLLHVRGEGRLALACAPGLQKIRLVPDQPAFVDEAALIGWVGRVIPQTVPRQADEDPSAIGVPLLRCEGEGVLLVYSGASRARARDLAPKEG